MDPDPLVLIAGRLSATSLVCMPEKLVRVADRIVNWSPTALHRILRPDHRDRAVRRRTRQVFEAALRARWTSGPQGSGWVVPSAVEAAFSLAEAFHPFATSWFYEDAWADPTFRAAMRAAHEPGWAEELLRAAAAAQDLGGPEAVSPVVGAAVPALHTPLVRRYRAGPFVLEEWENEPPAFPEEELAA